MHQGKKSVWIGLFLAIVVTATVYGATRPLPPAGDAGPANDAVMPGVIVFKLRESTSGNSAADYGSRTPLGRALGDERVSNIRPFLAENRERLKTAPLAADARLADIYVGTIPDGVDPRVVARRLSSRPEIVYAEPKYLQKMADIPNDPLLANQNEAFTRMNAFNGWTIAKGSSSVIIATVDGGTNWRHEDLQPNVAVNSSEDLNKNGVFDAADLNGVDDDGNGFVDDVVGWNFTNNSNDPSGLPATPLSYAHGTATASHFGAVSNNSLGMAGSSWNCSLLPVCVASTSGDKFLAFGYEGIVYAYRRGAKVINCSWGRTGGFSQFEQDVITAATAAGALVVAAAGNENSDSDVRAHFPSSYRGVFGVGATESVSDQKAEFSNYGVSVPVYAPGVNIFSAFSIGGYGNGGSGTSYSSPLVAGLAGILRALHPTWSVEQLAAQIRTTADPIDGVNPVYAGALGRGRVNFARALTESHPALDVTSATLRTPGGRQVFLSGDTVLLTITVRNVMPQSAANVQFTATTSNPLLQVANGTTALAVVAPGQTVTLPALRFSVATLSSAREVVIRVRWTINSTEQDGAAFRATLFPALPLWVMQLDGAGGNLFSVSAVNRSVVWAAGGNTFGTGPLVVRSTDGGETWLDRTGNLSSGDMYCVTALDSARAWAGTGDGDIVATTDGGVTWTNQPYPGRQSPFINGVRFFPDGTGFAQGDPPGDNTFVVLTTTNFGSTWTHAPAEPAGASGEAGWNNSFWWTDALHGWFGTNKNKVWRTTDGGGSWASAPTGSTNSFGVAFRDAATGYAIHDNGYIAKSTNGGQSWTGIASPTTDMLSAVTVVPGSASAWILSGISPYRTRTDGATWQPETLFPFTGSLNHTSFADTTRGWAVTSNGEILGYAPDLLTGVAPDNAVPVPREYALEQNYPNPFNPSTTIRYTVGEYGRGSGGEGTGGASMGALSGTVRLAVYDLLGREVVLLVNERKAPGRYEVRFDASGLSSGIYYYRIHIRSASGGNEFTQSRSMVIIR